VEYPLLEEKKAFIRMDFLTRASNTHLNNLSLLGTSQKNRKEFGTGLKIFTICPSKPNRIRFTGKSTFWQRIWPKEEKK
jgi:hypothetical protein